MSNAKASIRDIPLQGKRVFVRVDFNVPLSQAGQVENDARLQAAWRSNFSRGKSCQVLPASTSCGYEPVTILLAQNVVYGYYCTSTHYCCQLETA